MVNTEDNTKWMIIPFIEDVQNFYYIINSWEKKLSVLYLL